MFRAFFLSLSRIYGWHSASVLAGMLKDCGGNPLRYIGRFWTTQNFASLPYRRPLPDMYRGLVLVLRLGMMAQLVIGAALVWSGIRHDASDLLLFGLAAIVAYPLVWAHMLVPLELVALILNPKPIGRLIVCRVLEGQAKKLRRKHSFAVVAVAGSVGKTSTKLAAAQVLSTARKVRYQAGNYNDRVTVPLVLFGHDEPSLLNVMAWLKIFRANRRIIRREFPYDVVVVELGSDGIGQMKHFAYLRPELAILTAIQPEHMEQFGTMDNVAAEELTIFDFSNKVLVNIDDVPAEYLVDRQYVSYGGKKANYALRSADFIKLGQQKLNLDLAGQKLRVESKLLGSQGAKITVVAAATAAELGLNINEIRKALEGLEPFAGRMQLLDGLNGSKIIDDTYNSSPSAVAAALKVLESAKTSQRIAILGSMNELGPTSPEAHRAAGALCDPTYLKLIVTVGQDAKKYLAPAAKKAGCKVKSFLSATEAGKYVAKQLKRNAVVLAKGSQNGVFAEEAVKQLLKNSDDSAKLVRQSPYWLKVKGL